MENTTKRERPLSPHLQVYRLPYNAIMSISGRAAGIVLALVLVVVSAWFIAVAWNPALYDITLGFIKDIPYVGYAFLALAFLVFFYLGNGIRHALWDMGIGVNQRFGIISGNIVLVVALALTLGLWKISCDCWAQSEGVSITIEEGADNVTE